MDIYTSLYTVFGLNSNSMVYWGLIITIAFIIIGAVILNQILSDTLILKEWKSEIRKKDADRCAFGDA